ncbi:unnamed protein product [Trifolium pratense]|uniref:Uncharacterized protein n=1 Tax=Trifolium pratense TaxID=57577 RepID=A0ACB0MAK8_TRIPR|nr:unnamed protein product [Trifolium pratense]
MAPSYFPLRWESTGDQWWYATPIDLAAANGLYDLVTELLHQDTNNLIKLTSLRRIRRLETVWDDDESQFQDVAKCRSYVARKLLFECEEKGTGKNSLINGGYGGWLLYTAASAGDLEFVHELLRRDSLLVFGEGEYGVTDMLYAAARSNNFEVFNMILDFALLGREFSIVELNESGDGGGVFMREILNRAIHAAARGGNWEILKKQVLLGSASQILLSYRDAQGCTVLHSAAGRGQVEVVRNLILLSPDIINSTDSQGNTALHVACCRGYLSVVEILIQASPSLTMLTNQNGDTFLHMAVYGFTSPDFCKLDKHNELMNQLLLTEKIANLKDIINVKNNVGRTAIHLAVIHDVQCDVVESMMSVKSIDLNIRDADGMKPFDYLKQRPKSRPSKLLIKQFISAGSFINREDYMTRNAIVAHLKTHHGIRGSPGTLFRIPDSKIFLYSYTDNDQASVESNSCSIEVDSNYDSAENSSVNSKTSSVNSAARRLMNLLKWHKRSKRKEAASEFEGDDDSVNNTLSSRKNNLEELPISSLRQRYSKQCSLPNNKRTLSIRTLLPTQSAKKYFTAGLMQGVIKVKPQIERSNLSDSSNNKQKHVDTIGPIDDGGTLQLKYKEKNLNKKLMNRYFSFGAQGQALKDANSCSMSNHSSKCFSYL